MIEVVQRIKLLASSPTGVSLIAAASVALAASTASAQSDTDFDFEVEIPVLVEKIGPDDAQAGVTDIDLANVVQSAAKGVTTVQEAPTVVTVITGDDFRAKGYDNLEDVIDTIPGFLRLDAINNQFPLALSRGTVQSSLYLHNGVSLFDPQFNVPALSRVMPVEIIKRIETITGPGGVLWGANSFQGVVNVITKDASDVQGGLESGLRVGHGNGDRSVFRGYLMSGVTDLFNKGVDVFTHLSVESYKGPRFEMPGHEFSTPSPGPNSRGVWGPLAASDQPRSLLVNLDGKIEFGAISINYAFPFGERQVPLGFPGSVTRETLPEDTRVDAMGMPLCSPVEARLPNGQPNPDAQRAGDGCVDRARSNRESEQNFFDRYITAEYRTRFADSKAGATVRAYGLQFVRDFAKLAIWNASSLLETGLSIGIDGTSYRYGVSYDGDVELPANVRILYGGEAAREQLVDNTSQSLQGAGRESNIFQPLDLSRLAQPCPRAPDPDNPGQVLIVPVCPLTAVFEADRTTVGAYFNPQWRPFRNLILDGGVRVQSAPAALSSTDLGFKTQLLFSGAAVLNFLRDWHLKLNYAEGFRPPVFNNTNSNGRAVQVDGDPNLEVETSQAIQGEVNARLFKGKKQIREVNFRADYSYTVLENLIQIQGGRYVNEADRGIHSAEFLGKVFLQGGHSMELSYTWLMVNSAGRGRMNAFPEHWFNLSGVFNLIPNRLSATTTLRIRGAMEDANRLVEYRNLSESGQGGMPTQVAVGAFDLVRDRLPPGANVSAGLFLRATDRVMLSAMAYNAFNARYYQTDGFDDLEPRFEFLPNPYQDFRFTIGMTVNP